MPFIFELVHDLPTDSGTAANDQKTTRFHAVNFLSWEFLSGLRFSFLVSAFNPLQSLWAGCLGCGGPQARLMDPEDTQGQKDAGRDREHPDPGR